MHKYCYYNNKIWRIAGTKWETYGDTAKKVLLLTSEGLQAAEYAEDVIQGELETLRLLYG